MKDTKPSGWEGTPYELFPEVGEHDLEVSLRKPIEQVDEELRQRGLDPQKLSADALPALKKALAKK
jgi:hypothetical protein